MDNNPWIKRFERERASRKEAEKLLEDKSIALYEANLLLEKKVQERTAALESALIEAQAAQKAKDTFFANMSHELRTPLNAIIGFSQILSHQEDVPLKIKTFVEKINIAGNNLLNLINTILNFSKIESDSIILNIQEIEIKTFIKELLILVEPQAKQKSISLHVESHACGLYADKQLLNQALLNLLSNAVKFTPENGTISLVCAVNKKEFSLHICDNGVGIAKEDLSKLFQPFSQIENQYQAKTNGTGLGLYLTKKIIELHHGTIEVTSKINEGTCFFIKIPLLKDGK